MFYDFDLHQLSTNESLGQSANLSDTQLSEHCKLEIGKSKTYWQQTDFILNISDQLLLFYPWIMIVTGTVTNSISFIVFTRPKLKKSSTFFYLSCLCIIDLLSLYTFCLNFILFYKFNIDIQLKNIIICKLYSFLTYFLPQFSGWTCAAVSFDRLIGVLFSTRARFAAAAKRWNTPARASRVMCALFMCIFLLNVHFLFYEYEDRHNSTSTGSMTRSLWDIQDVNMIYCSPENIDRFKKFYSVWVHIDLSANVLIPFAIMIASSVVIVARLLKSTQNLSVRHSSTSGSTRSSSSSQLKKSLRKKLSETKQKSITVTAYQVNGDQRANSVNCTSIPVLSTASPISSAIQAASIPVVTADVVVPQVRFRSCEPSSNTTQPSSPITTANNNHNHANNASLDDVVLRVPRPSLQMKRKSSSFSGTVSNKAKSVSYMLATNNFVFISLTLPIVVFLSFTPEFSSKTLCPLSKAWLRLVKVICIMLMNANCAVNIFIYSLMSTDFRCQLITLVREFFCCYRNEMSTYEFRRVTTKKSSRHSSGDFADSKCRISSSK